MAIGAGKNAVPGPTSPEIRPTAPPAASRRNTRSTLQGSSATRAEVEMENYQEIVSDEIANLVIVAMSTHMACMLATAEQLESNTKEIERILETQKVSQPPSMQANSSSYSDALKMPNTQSHPIVNAAIARAGIKERQVLLDPINGEPIYNDEQTAVSIAKDLQKILMSIKQLNSPKLEVKAITKLKNGGLIFELESAASAKWIRNNNRHCPTYEREHIKLDERQPENSMPYYPTDESWTQVLLPPKPPSYRKPPPTAAADHHHHHQNEHRHTPMLKQTTLGYRATQNEQQPTSHGRGPPTMRGRAGFAGTRGQFSPASSSNRIPIQPQQQQQSQRTITSYLDTEQRNANTNPSTNGPNSPHSTTNNTPADPSLHPPTYPSRVHV
ncbi:hypothetical protein PAXINDRAFT_156865 [Paxillus involutus ATCC 200175]|uniref:Uncharacterized protein n=1 Tax=Paxillus involutus ATCC 200175 TaxID=664439 RepID=A0A0C9TZD7_PAXIN|nr:hypothetical protein PAXINDRAFT_156865 [Paxillus involutus ATCC 200175]